MSDQTRSVVPVVALGLAVLTVALFVVGLPVVVAPGRTDRYFAWTIDVPLTAAFLGACYWTAALFTLLSARERTWSQVRVVMPGILVAGALILVATLVHLDRFATDTARAWIWVILYSGLVPGVLFLLALQRTAHAVDPPVRRPVEPWATVLLALMAAVLLLTGFALFAFPRTTGPWWLWPVTELTARMIGAWLAAIGVTLVAVLREGDWTRVRAAMVYLAAVAAALLATLARYPGTVEWGDVAAWAYLAVYATMLMVAVHGIRVQPSYGCGGYSRSSRSASADSSGRVWTRRWRARA
jgi:hypothetical protein